MHCSQPQAKLSKAAAKPQRPDCLGPPSQRRPFNYTSCISQIVGSRSCGQVHTHCGPVPMLEKGRMLTAKRESDLEKLRGLGGETEAQEY